MHVFETISDLNAHLHEISSSKSIGFVPTMGALHAGHASLINKAKTETDVVVCSIFVNPTQFNDPNDLAKYPRTIEEDKNLLIKSNCEVLFVPSVEEIYPNRIIGSKLEAHGEAASNSELGTFKPSLDLGALDKVMEASQRPGHFKGVVQVVSRLFDIVMPHKAYFGQKDFQQVAVIREMVKQLGYNIQIIPCPIVRELDGLAMSSRNVRLTAEERKIAPLIFNTLNEVKKMSQEPSNTIKGLIAFAANKIRSCKEMSLEYFEIVDATTLLPVNELNSPDEVVACIAIKLGQIRLIDNIILK